VEWVTGPAILAHARVPAPDADTAAWADTCASAVNAALDRRLAWADVPVTDPPWTPPVAASDELEAIALLAGAEAFARRGAPFGVTGYSDLQGIAIRVARDYVEGVQPQIDRWRYVAGSFG